MTLITVDDLVIDDRRRVVTLAGEPVELPRLQFDFLAKLASDPERVWKRDDLLREVWGYQSITRTRSIDVCASSVRRALHRRFVFSVRKVGYRLLES